ncbi:helix-turn-helix transcriptional regulator [Bailinhaonella thermotolerans]|uniref:helix-turn-helix transcriptional regulator n=1 Tax=Bailinhaonella thermotolerans TaxID=1070861 RepID=UPI0026978C68
MGRRQSVPVELLACLRRARDHMDRHYREPLDLDALARVAGVSKYHFARCFEATYGETPIRYLTRRRIERAQDLLRAANLTVTEVCMMVGFSSLGSFSSRFSQLVGESPAVYRDRWAARGGARVPGCFLFMRSVYDPSGTAAPRAAVPGSGGPGGPGGSDRSGSSGGSGDSDRSGGPGGPGGSGGSDRSGGSGGSRDSGLPGAPAGPGGSGREGGPADPGDRGGADEPEETASPGVPDSPDVPASPRVPDSPDVPTSPGAPDSPDVRDGAAARRGTLRNLGEAPGQGGRVRSAV